MDLPKRKANRLPRYNYSSGGSYFITVCTQNTILCRIVDCGDGCPTVRLTPAGKIVKKNIAAIDRAKGVRVENYVIMPDHIHLIVFIDNPEGEIEKGNTPANERVPQVISAFKRYTQKETGLHIFQRGYYDHVIRDDRDYEIKWQYIEDNPANWLEKKKWLAAKKEIDVLRQKTED